MFCVCRTEDTSKSDSRPVSDEMNTDIGLLSQRLPAIILPSVHELNLFKSFLTVISHIQSLWELVLTCEPIVVMGEWKHGTLHVDKETDLMCLIRTNSRFDMRVRPITSSDNLASEILC